MNLFYSLGIILAASFVRLASWFNPKAKAFVSGRKDQFQRLSAEMQNIKGSIWVHCASLGEFEQGRPIIEEIRKQRPKQKILLTFFSPSGFNVRKNYSQVDHVFYLPWDTSKNAQQWIEIVNPVLAIFIKYEFWLNYIDILSKKNIPILSASSIFRKDQIFFKWYGSLFRTALQKFDHFFVQNISSAELLSSIQITNVTVSGDTRFDRVQKIAMEKTEIPKLSSFKGSDSVWVMGSCWPADVDILIPFILENKTKLKFIIAPHEMRESFLNKIETALGQHCIRFSQLEKLNERHTVLLIDNIGMLSQLYSYAEFAYVGGAFGKGLHNILEAACYGIPVFFGNKNYNRFSEANDLIQLGGAFVVADFPELKECYQSLINRPENYLLACEVTKAYVTENLGATQKVVDYIKKIIS